MNNWFKLFDPDPGKGGGAQPITPSEAPSWNKQGFGIFWSVNDFDGPRQIKNLTAINAWTVDLDAGSKTEQLKKLMSGLEPSLLVETKKGHHAYWYSLPFDAKAENYRDIEENRLIKFYGGDLNAKDLARLLRIPNFLHQKEISDPFLVKMVYYSNNFYSERDIYAFYKTTEQVQKKEHDKKEFRKIFRSNSSGDEDLFQKIYDMDCEWALSKLSGTEAVCYETFSFKPTTRGNLNLIVNGKGTSVFIDREKRIGSSDRGGPTVWQFVNWYHKDHKKTYQHMKDNFPELFK